MSKSHSGSNAPHHTRAVHPVPGKVDAPPQNGVSQLAAEPVPGNSGAPLNDRAVHPIPGKVNAST